MLIEDLAPREIREKRIDLKLWQPPPPRPPPPEFVPPPDYKPPQPESVPAPQANLAVAVAVSYTRTLPAFVMMPLIFEVQGPSSLSYQRRVLRRAPETILFTPREGGRHLVVLRESAHNRFWGSLVIDVIGQPLTPPTVI